MPRSRGAPTAFCEHPGQLGPIAEVLRLPILAVVSCRGSESGAFHLPAVPDRADAVLLDEVDDPDAVPRLKRLLELATGLPVIGAVETLPQVRAPPWSACPRLRNFRMTSSRRSARGFLPHSDLPALDDLARSRPFPDADARCAWGDQGRRRFRVAYAQDEAFGGYFPDTIEALEALGADLVEFSPLRDEALPDGVGLVMIGCGVPDRHAEVLAANHSMIAALGEHVCVGRRIYSEGGGTAYLGRGMLIDGRFYRAPASFRSSPSSSRMLPRPHPSCASCCTTRGSGRAAPSSAATGAADGG